MHDDATSARELLNSPEMDHTAAAAFSNEISSWIDQDSAPRLQPLVRALKEALSPIEPQ